MDRDSLGTNAGSSSSHAATSITPVGRKKIVTGAQGKYELEAQPFSSGSHSLVFKAKETTTEVISACKVINLRKPSITDEERDNIDREVAILSLMQHENIVAFVDQYRTRDQIYIFSELVQGTTLVEYYQNNNNYLTECDARSIFRQICRAVEYIHKHGIIHRDIKSENVLIDENLKIKLIDFGLARRTDGPHVLKDVCGTLSYMAPEIRKGSGYDLNVDIWSLGVLLFRMLVGEYPFDDDLYDKPDEKETEGDHTPDQGSGPNYLMRDWRPFVDKQSKRSSEVKHLLESMFEIDPSRRARIDQILASDWMQMIDEILCVFDKIELSGSNRILKSSEASGSSENIAQVQKKPWGELTIIPGGFRDAPRRIVLKNSSYILGRIQEENVDILLGSNRAISVKHCIIRRDDSGVVMMANTSLNGTYINNSYFGKMRSGQLFNGDILGIVVCKGHFPVSPDTILGCSYCLQYKVTLFGAEDTTIEQLACRIYTDHSYRGYKKRRPEDRIPDYNIPIWGTLVGQKGLTETEELQGERVIIGRDKSCDIVLNNDYISRRHCVIEWVATEKKAYLTCLSRNGTLVNDEPFEGRLQLRDEDVIRVINTVEETGRERIRLSYKFLVHDKETIPAEKRAKSEPVNVPGPIASDAASPTVEESSEDELDEIYGQSFQQADEQDVLQGRTYQQEEEEED